MAISKSAKIMAKIEKVETKISEQQAKLKELEQRHRETENEEIVDIVWGISIYIHGETAPVRYYPINEEAARRSKDMNSFYDYKPGSATAAYRAMVDEAAAIAERQKACVDPMYHDKIDSLVDRYACKLAANLNDANAIDARVPSVLIAGPANFPVRQKHKQNAARDRNMDEFMEIQKLFGKIQSVGMGGISTDDIHAVEKLESLKADQERMKVVNAYYRKHKTLEGCPGLTSGDIGKLQTSMVRDWRKDLAPYPSFHLSNNNAKIHQMEQHRALKGGG